MPFQNESEIVPFPNKNGCFDVLESDVSELCEKSFPRTPYINSQSTESMKTDSSQNPAITPSGPTQGELNKLLRWQIIIDISHGLVV